MNRDKIGKFIANQRKEQGMTQMQFAEKLGITNKAVSKWETGKCLPDAELFSDICLLLKCTLNELFAGEKIIQQQIEKTTEEKLVSRAAECQERKYDRSIIIKYIVALLMVICISINIKVGGIWLEGSPVFSNLMILIIISIGWIMYIRMNRENKKGQIVSAICSTVVLVASSAAYILNFWDINSNVVFVVGYPSELLFYGLRIFFGWAQIYIVASGLSLLSLVYSKKNLKKLSG